MKHPPWFYGWNIVGYTMVVHFVTVGAAYYAFGAFLKPLTEALDTDRFTLSLAMSIQMVLAAVIAPWLGARLRTGNFRRIVLLGACATGVALSASALVNTPWQLYLTFGAMLAVGMSLNGIVPMNALLANWFVGHRGAAMGIAQLGITLSGVLLVPLVTWIIMTFGWRPAFLTLGIAAPLIVIPLTLWLMVPTPEQMQLHPDGAPEAPPGASGENPPRSIGQILTMPRVWLLALVVGPCFMGIAGVVLTLHSHATDLGLTALTAASVVAAATTGGAIAKPLFGVLADHLPTRAVFALSLLLQAAGIAGLLVVTDYGPLLFTVAVYGLGFGSVAPLWSILVAELFGRDEFARVMGAITPLTLPFNLFGLPVTTLVFEYTGSYVPAYGGILGSLSVAAIALWALGEQDPQA